MKAYIRHGYVYFVPTDSEAATLGEAVELKCENRTVTMTPVAIPESAIKGTVKRALYVRGLNRGYFYKSGMSNAGLTQKHGNQPAEELRTMEWGAGFRVVIPDFWYELPQVQATPNHFPEEPLTSSNAAIDKGAGKAVMAPEPPARREGDLRDALTTINAAIDKNEVEALVRDGKVVLRLVTEMV